MSHLAFALPRAIDAGAVGSCRRRIERHNRNALISAVWFQCSRARVADKATPYSNSAYVIANLTTSPRSTVQRGLRPVQAGYVHAFVGQVRRNGTAYKLPFLNTLLVCMLVLIHVYQGDVLKAIIRQMECVARPQTRAFPRFAILRNGTSSLPCWSRSPVTVEAFQLQLSSN